MGPLSECLALDTLNQTLRKRPLSASLRYSIEADWEITHTYNSNAIEGNTLTLAETKAVLLHGVTVSGKPLRDHLEATNHLIDGNGRTARLLMNLLLLRAGYPAALIPVSARPKYYATLEDANHGDLRPFERFIVCRVREGILDLLALTED